MTTFTLPINALRAALTHAADGDVRYYLNGIYVDTSAGRIVATDGARLFICDGPRADCPPVILPRADVERVLKSLGAEYGRGRAMSCAELPTAVQATDGKVWVTVDGPSGAKFTFPAVDGRFPTYGTVIPRAVQDLAYSTINWAYAHAACEAIAIYRDAPKNKPEKCQVGVWTAGNNAALFTDGAPGALALVMPQRSDVTGIDAFADALAWAHGTSSA